MSPIEHGFWTRLGQAWTTLARLIFELYVPDAVLDPLVVQDREDNASPLGLLVFLT